MSRQTLSLISTILILRVSSNLVCPPGTYGDRCDKICPEHCNVFPAEGLVYCQKTSGECLEGCIPGWYADTCNRECSKNCVNNICNQLAGECTQGCIDGKDGTFCELDLEEEGHPGKTQENSAGIWAGVASAVVVIVVVIAIIKAIWSKCLQKWLDQGPVMDTSLHKAILNGDLGVVKQLMNDGDIDVNSRGLYGLTPLMLAAVTGQHDVFEYFKRQEADMTLTDCDGDHILSIACVGGNMDIVKDVVSKEPDFINRKRNDGRTSLMWAASHGKETIFGYLLDNGADYRLMDNDEDNILHYTCQGGHPGILKRVLAETEIDINSSDKCGRTAAMVAAEHGHKEVFDILVRNGSDISHEDKDGNNILHAACRIGHVEMVEHVLSQGVFNCNCRGYGATPLMLAAHGGHRDVFDLLVGKGADASLPDNMGNNILHMACMEGHEGMVQHILSQQMVDINSLGQCGRTPLLWAAWREHNAVIRVLMSLGADLLLVDDDENNILHIVCKTGNEKIVRLVLSKKRLDINARNRRGETAFILANDAQHMELCELLSHEQALGPHNQH